VVCVGRMLNILERAKDEVDSWQADG
jgi:hypothetical protein